MTLRWIEVGRGAWGAALLLAPRRALRATHATLDTTSVNVTRVLGARQLAQAALSGVNPSPEVLATGVWVDAAHSATAIALAVTDHRRARAGLVDAAVAAVWAGIGARDLSHAEPTAPGHDRIRDRLARLVLPRLPGGSALLRRARRRRT
ncbi:MAG: hypothetical protein ABI181_13800 [Mycobacteriaceae bacterium]